MLRGPAIPRFPRVVKRSHRIYTHKQIDKVLEYLSSPELPMGAITQISRDTGIPKQTLSDWHRKRISPGKEDWFPLAKGRPRRHALTDEQEAAIYDHIKANFIDSGLGCTRQDVQAVALNSYMSLDPDDMQADRFAGSNRWIDGFIHRWNLSLRKPHGERRPEIDLDAIMEFKDHLEQIYRDYPKELIINMDETSWRLNVAPGLVLAEKGRETVKLKGKKNEKQSFTAFGSITASGEKLPLWVIGKGKTRRCLTKFGVHTDVRTAHTPSGWSTEDLMVDYLTWISTEIAHGVPCALIMDVYPAHKSQKVREKAEELWIDLVYVPAGGTSEYQPLDRRVFGELKSRARCEARRFMSQNGTREVDWKDAVRFLEQCWARIEQNNVEKAWQLQWPSQE